MALGFRQILVDGSPVGFQGLDSILDALCKDGWQPGQQGLGAELIKRLAPDNYIPRSARTNYSAALEREFAAYLARRESGVPTRKTGYGTWRGHPRETIPWFPTVNADLCDGCGVCLRMCSTHCLVPTDDGKVWVADPFACVVGCSSCAAICKPDAITFPPRSILDAYRVQ
jgi:NAD-dependent dihydropyrimidine dehydrogenase PreA subunit